MGKLSKAREIAQTGARLDEKRSLPLCLALAGPAGKDLDRLSDLLMPLTHRALVHRIVLDSEPVILQPDVELAVVVVGDDLRGARGILERARTDRVFVLVVRIGGRVEAHGGDTGAHGRHSEALAPSDEALRALGIGEGDIIDLNLAEDASADGLFAAMLKRLPAKRLALCANFEGARSHAARSVIGATAWQNAAMAGVIFVPGADMPVLTGNQIKMVLELAAIYDKQMSFERAKELLAVIGAGFTLRTIAREGLGFVPGPGWMLKAGIAYAGTVAIGKAAQRYFLDGDGWGQAAREKLGALRRVGGTGSLDR